MKTEVMDQIAEEYCPKPVRRKCAKSLSTARFYVGPGTSATVLPSGGGNGGEDVATRLRRDGKSKSMFYISGDGVMREVCGGSDGRVGGSSSTAVATGDVGGSATGGNNTKAKVSATIGHQAGGRVRRRVSLLLPWRKGVDSGFQSSSSTSFPAPVTNPYPYPARGPEDLNNFERLRTLSQVVEDNPGRTRRILPSEFGPDFVNNNRDETKPGSGVRRAPTPYAIPVPVDFQKESVAFHEGIQPGCDPCRQLHQYQHPLKPHRPAPPPPQFIPSKQGTLTRPRSAVYPTGAHPCVGHCGAIPGSTSTGLGLNGAPCSLPFPNSHLTASKNNRGSVQSQEDASEGTLLQKFKKTFSWRFSSIPASSAVPVSAASSSSPPPSSSSSAIPTRRSSASGPASLPQNCVSSAPFIACSGYQHLMHDPAVPCGGGMHRSASCDCSCEWDPSSRYQTRWRRSSTASNTTAIPNNHQHSYHHHLFPTANDNVKNNNNGTNTNNGLGALLLGLDTVDDRCGGTGSPPPLAGSEPLVLSSAGAAPADSGASSAERIIVRRQQPGRPAGSSTSSVVSKRLSGDSGIMMMCDTVPTDVQAKNRSSQSTSIGAFSSANPSSQGSSGLPGSSGVLHDLHIQDEVRVIDASSTGPGREKLMTTAGVVEEDEGRRRRLSVASSNEEPAGGVAAPEPATQPKPAAILCSRKISLPDQCLASNTSRRVYAKNKDSRRRFQRTKPPPPPLPHLSASSSTFPHPPAPLLWRSTSQPSDLNTTSPGNSMCLPPPSALPFLPSEATAAAAAATRARSMRHKPSHRRRTRRSITGTFSDDDLLTEFRLKQDVGDDSASSTSSNAPTTTSPASSCSLSCDEVGQGNNHSINNNASNNNNKLAVRRRRVRCCRGSGVVDAGEEGDDDYEEEEEEEDEGGKTGSECNDSGHHGSESQCSSGNNDQAGDFMEPNGLILAEALWDHSTTDGDELAFRAGDVIEVLDTSFQQWWWGELHDPPENRQPAPAGWFPAAFVRLRVSPEGMLAEETEDSDSQDSSYKTTTGSKPNQQEPAMLDTHTKPLNHLDHHHPARGSPQLRNRNKFPMRSREPSPGMSQNNNNNVPQVPGGLQPSASTTSVATIGGTNLNRRSSILLSHDQVRGNVIKEIISSEKEFLKNLCDVKQGYLHQVRRRPDMFSRDHVTTIFGNIEALYDFQSEFVEYLEAKINYKQPHKSCVGECFRKYRTGFRVYTEYCNNHPSALALLQELYEDPKFCHFFEACRLLQKMIDISLDGFLLTPVQRICKYPLQLAELAKYTKPDHPDHADVLDALEEMRGVAATVNESRRRREGLESLIKWEASVTGWEGPSLLDTSSLLIHQGDVFILKGSHSVSQKSKDLTLFLFDHLLVYCRRDLLKKTSFAWKGKIPLDECHIEDCPDGKDEHLGVVLKNAWKVVNTPRSHYYLFFTRTLEEKLEWMAAFTKERTQVKHDRENDIRFTEKEKDDARRAALASKNNKFKKPKGKPGKVKLDPDLMENLMRQMDSSSATNHQHLQTASLSRLPSKQGPTLHYRNDIRYHSSTMRPTTKIIPTGPAQQTIMPRTHMKDLRVYVGLEDDEAEDEDADGSGWGHHVPPGQGGGGNNTLSKKRSTWFNFGQKRIRASDGSSSTFYAPA